MEERTVDRDGHDLCEFEVIGSDESWDLVEGIQLDILGVGIRWLSMDEFDVEVIGFGNRKQNCGSGIALRIQSVIGLPSVA